MLEHQYLHGDSLLVQYLLLQHLVLPPLLSLLLLHDAAHGGVYLGAVLQALRNPVHLLLVQTLRLRQLGILFLQGPQHFLLVVVDLDQFLVLALGVEQLALVDDVLGLQTRDLLVDADFSLGAVRALAEDLVVDFVLQLVQWDGLVLGESDFIADTGGGLELEVTLHMR